MYFDLLSESQTTEMSTYIKRLSLAQKCIVELWWILKFAIELQHCENYTQWPLPTFWRSNIWNIKISETVRARQKCMARLRWENFVPWPRPTFSKILKCYISQTVRGSYTKIVRTIDRCVHLRLTSVRSLQPLFVVLS